jgi:MFS family permease
MWSAIALAVFFGAVAIPVGLVFMMLDDRRKVEIGKVTLISGIVSTIVHAILTAWLVQALFFSVLIPRTLQAFGGAAGGGDLNQKVAPLNFPGIPRTPEQEVPFPTAPTYERPMPR